MRFQRLTSAAFVVTAIVALAAAAVAQQSGGGPPADRAAAARAAAEAIAAQLKEAAARPTPRSADGHPDLSGHWVEPSPRMAAFLPQGKTGKGVDRSPEIHVFPPGLSVANVNAGDRASAARRLADPSLRPKYKPQFAAKAAQFFERGDLDDPTFGCALPGVVRLGVPREIFQQPGALVLLYEDLVNRYRVIPVDGRKADPDADPLPMGHPLGHWDGDSLVIESSGFYGDYWLDKDGSYYSSDMKLTERLTRQGDTLRFELLVNDPMFVEPFKPKPVTLVRSPAGTHVLEEYGCVEQDRAHMVNGAKH